MNFIKELMKGFAGLAAMLLGIALVVYFLMANYAFFKVGFRWTQLPALLVDLGFVWVLGYFFYMEVLD